MIARTWDCDWIKINFYSDCVVSESGADCWVSVWPIVIVVSQSIPVSLFIQYVKYTIEKQIFLLSAAWNR